MCIAQMVHNATINVALFWNIFFLLANCAPGKSNNSSANRGRFLLSSQNYVLKLKMKQGLLNSRVNESCILLSASILSAALAHK